MKNTKIERRNTEDHSSRYMSGYRRQQVVGDAGQDGAGLGRAGQGRFTLKRIKQ